MSHELSQDRQLAIWIMRRCGWSHNPVGASHRFSKPDPCGDGDIFHSVKTPNLSSEWALRKCGDNDLEAELSRVRMAWLFRMKAAFRNTYAAAPEAKP